MFGLLGDLVLCGYLWWSWRKNLQPWKFDIAKFGTKQYKKMDGAHFMFNVKNL